MKSYIRGALALLFLSLAPPSQAAIRVLATTADWGALATELGGERVDVYTATTALQDVHRVDAKPSLVARARTADLVVANGAELEVGWLPVLLQESGNARIQRGQPGYFEAVSALSLLEVPSRLDRAMGDIHPLGNPHVQLDPRNIAAVAKALTAKLIAIDPAGADYYSVRGADFTKRWARRSYAGSRRPRRSRTSRSWSCTATRPIFATGWASRNSPLSSQSPACRPRPATSASSLQSSRLRRRASSC